MITLGTAIGGAALAMGGKKAEDPTTPPINAKNKDEENFVKCVHVHAPYSPVPRTAILHVQPALILAQRLRQEGCREGPRKAIRLGLEER